MNSGRQGDVTALLLLWAEGSRPLADSLFPLVQKELHRIASRYMRREAPNHVLQTTALVNEAYLRLIDQDRVSWKDRVHFFGIAAKLMRNVLVDEGRRKRSQKRGGLYARVPLNENVALEEEMDTNVLALDEALEKLARRDERKAKIIELRCFSGLETKEIAALLGVSEQTVKRDWRLAKVWLERELERPAQK